jgi:hypothetical protein
MIQKYGMPCVLRRASGDRPCTAAISEFTAMERLGKVVNPLDRKALVSALDPSGAAIVPPSFSSPADSLITFIPTPGQQNSWNGAEWVDPNGNALVQDQVLRINEPPTSIGPADTPIFYRLMVRR